MIHYISPVPLTFETIENILNKGYKLALSEESKQLINDCKAYLDEKIARSEKPLYGITTGFGSLCKISISPEDLSQLQANLVMSHACSVGEPIHKDIIRLMLLLKAHALSLGKSGVQLATVERIIDMYNHDVLPVVRELGSLGASGDLAPLANLFLPLINEGTVYYKGKIQDAKEVNEKLGWSPIALGAKEGLALLNGTQFMSSHAVYALLKAFKIVKYADIIGAISLDAYDGRIDPFLPQIHEARPHPGQIETARNIRALLKDSEFQQKPKVRVQDPYSFRCMPQVHGACKDTVMYVASVVEREINSVTDNPTIFVEDDMIVSAGENIYPPQIEAVLNDHPKVAESAVIGAPDKLRGEVVAAYVVPSDPSLTVEELKEYCTNSPMLSSYKWPRIYNIVDSLPHTATGKIMHRALRNKA